MLCFGTIVLTSGQHQVSIAFHERVVSTTRVVQKLLRVESQRSLRHDRKLSTELTCAFVVSVAIMHGLRAPRQFHDKVHRNSRAYRLVGQPIFSKTSLSSCACVIGVFLVYQPELARNIATTGFGPNLVISLAVGTRGPHSAVTESDTTALRN